MPAHGRALFALTTLLLVLGFSGPALAGTFTADQLFDAQDGEPGDGRCDASPGTPGQQCTLRAAIQETNALQGRDTVVLLGGTYALTLPSPAAEQRAATGDLDIRGRVTVRGAGLDQTTISATNDRHFHVIRSVTDARISRLALVNGDGVGGPNTGRGGGVLNGGTLSLQNVALRQNRGVFGGAVDNRGTLTMGGSTVGNNAGVFGGGLYNEGQLRIFDSTISNNTAVRGAGDNGGLGGGLYNTAASASITNGTIASNTAEIRGGGLSNAFGDVRLLNTTVNENTAPGGASLANGGTRTYLGNTIVAGGVGGDECAGARTVSLGNNLVADESCNLGERGDREGVDPLLSPIADDDDPLARIFRPRPGSPAVDGGDNGACPTFDQRGLRRPKDGDGNGVPRCDVGSVEVKPRN